MTALILGIIQGLTELLPVSSSGHLVLFEKLLGIDLKDVSFEVSVHVATALALCFVLRREIWLMLRSILPKGSMRPGGAHAAKTEVGKAHLGKAEAEGSRGSGARVLGAATSLDERTRGRRLILAVLVGSLPAALLGAGATHQIEAVFHGVTLTLAMLLVTGVFLLLTRWARDKSEGVTMLRALIVGVAQAVAILPGISRSGLTVGTGLFMGIAKEEAVKFSFLLSIPAVGGAALLKLMGGSGAAPGIGAQNLAIAAIAAFFSALVGTRVLLGAVRRGKFEYFGYYCLAAGALGLLLWAQ